VGFVFIVLKSVFMLTDVMLNVMVPYLNFFLSNTFFLSPPLSHNLSTCPPVSLPISLTHFPLSYLTDFLPLSSSFFLRIFFHFLSLCIYESLYNIFSHSFHVKKMCFLAELEFVLTAMIGFKYISRTREPLVKWKAQYSCVPCSN